MSARDGKFGSAAGGSGMGGSGMGGSGSDGGSRNSTGFDLDSAIAAVRSEHGTAAQALALEQRLAETLGRAALAGAGGASGAAWGGGWLLLLGLGAGALGLLAVHEHSAAKQHASNALHAEPATPSPQLALQGAAFAPVAVIAPVEPVLSAQAPEPSNARRSRAHAHPHGRAHGVTHVAARAQAQAREQEHAPSAGSVQDELELLQRSRAALHSDPRAAFELAEQHARTYPHGLFVQEREVLAIEALLRQHARPAAIARAHAFVGRNPDSPYALRIRAMLDQLPADPAPAVETPAR